MSCCLWTLGVALVGFVSFLYVVSKNFLVSRVTPIALKGKHVLITGGSKGIGKAVAVEAAKQGANVTIIARNEVHLKETWEELKGICDINAVKTGVGQRAHRFSANLLSGPEEIERKIREAENELGPIDVLVNNVGGSVQEAFENLPASAFEDQMRVNYLSAVYATRAVVPGMKSRKNFNGRIAFISSQAGQLGLYGYTAYSGAKFALRGFAEALQMELSPYNVRITVGFPPNTDTEGFQLEMETMPKETKQISETSGLWKPKDVAKVLLLDICDGTHYSTFGMDGWLLGLVSCGMSPETEGSSVVQQVLLMGLARLISLGYLKYFDRIVSKCAKEKDPSSFRNTEE